MASSAPALEAPAAPGFPVLGQLPAIQRDVLGAFERASRHGDVVRMDFPRPTAFLLNHPDAVRHVLVDAHRTYGKNTRGYRVLSLALGAGLVTSQGATWRRQRRIAQPSFHPQRLGRFLPVMNAAVLRMLDGWASGRDEAVDVDAEMMRLTLEIVGRCLLSTDLSADSDEVGGAITTVLHEVAHRMLHPFGAPYGWPTPRNLRMRAALGRMHRLVDRIIAQRRRSGEAPEDLLTSLMTARDPETGEAMDDLQLRDEVMTMVSAGHETTANALSWALHFLAGRPRVRARLEAEIDEVLGDEAMVGEDTLARLTYCEAVLKEAMRLRPPVWMLARSAESDDRVLGYRIPQGSYVFVCMYTLHRDPRFWRDPGVFEPERFLGERGRSIPRHLYLPFSGGPRICIGAAFAMMEAKILLAQMVRRVRFEPVDGGEVGLDPTVTLRPKGGLRLRMCARRGEEPLSARRGEEPLGARRGEEPLSARRGEEPPGGPGG